MRRFFAKVILLCVASFFFFHKNYGQNVQIVGRVIDEISSQGIAYTSIKTGIAGFVSDSGGYFSIHLSKQVLSENKTVFSAVNYLHKFVQLSLGDTANFILIKLLPSNNPLKDVVVYSDDYGLKIVQKAIRKIPVNYLQKPFAYNIFQDTYNKVDSNGYTFHDNSVFKTYFEPASDFMQIKIVQNKQEEKLNDTTLDKESINRPWMGNNSVPGDAMKIYTSPFLNMHKLSDYKYVYKTIASYNGTDVYVIDFTARNDKKLSGTLFIDTATYAVSGIYTLKTEPKIYNAQMHFGLFYSTYTESRVNYAKQQNGIWIFKDLQNEYRVYIREKAGKISYSQNRVNAELLGIDSNATKIKSGEYADPVPIQKYNLVAGNTDEWRNVEQRLHIKTIDTSLAIHMNDTSKIAGANHTTYRRQRNMLRVREYLLTSIHLIVSVNQQPFNLPLQQPALNKNLSFPVNYGIGRGVMFKLYKTIFGKYQSISNFGIGHLKSSNQNYMVGNHFNLYRYKLYFSPQAGYSSARIKSGKENLYKQNSFLAVAEFDYKLTAHKSLFLGFNYLPANPKYISDKLLINPHHYFCSFGINL